MQIMSDRAAFTPADLKQLRLKLVPFADGFFKGHGAALDLLIDIPPQRKERMERPDDDNVHAKVDQSVPIRRDRKFVPARRQIADQTRQNTDAATTLPARQPSHATLQAIGIR